MDERNMEKRGGKRCYAGKNYDSDWADGNIYEGSHLGCQGSLLQPQVWCRHKRRSSSRHLDKGKAPIEATTSQEEEVEEAKKIARLYFGLDGMEAYMSPSRRHGIITEGQPQWAVLKGEIHFHDLKFEARMWLDFVCARIISFKNTTHVPIEVAILVAFIMDQRHINVGEIIAEQFKRKARQQATSIPYPILISLLRLRANCPMFRPLDKTRRVEGVINLSTKKDKDTPTSMWLKLTLGTNTPLSSMLSGDAFVSPQADRNISPPTKGLLKM
ncbi:hypothetical protein HAX54_047778, partial [Datura stramonium]|nr:hypothetical protein [Datura stramonium]